jgi:hypothetical protein
MFVQCIDPLQCRYGTLWDGSTRNNGYPSDPSGASVYYTGLSDDVCGSYQLDKIGKAYKIMLGTKIYKCEFSYNISANYGGSVTHYTGSGSFPVIVGNASATQISPYYHQKLGSLAAFDYGGDCSNTDSNVDETALYLFPPYDAWGVNEESGQVCYTGLNGGIFLPVNTPPFGCGDPAPYVYRGNFINTLLSTDNTHNYNVNGGDNPLGDYFSLSVPYPNIQHSYSYFASLSINVFHDSNNNFYYQPQVFINHVGGGGDLGQGGIIFFKPNTSDYSNAVEIPNAITSNFHWNGNDYSISQSVWVYGFGDSSPGIPAADLSGSTCSVTITPIEYWTYSIPSNSEPDSTRKDWYLKSSGDVKGSFPYAPQN